MEINWEDNRFVKFSDERKQLVWDASSLSAAQRCARYYKNSVMDGWSSKNDGGATGWGKIVHSGVETLDKVKFEGGNKDEAIDAAVRTVIEVGAEPLADADDNARTLETAVRAVVWRAEQYWDDSFITASLPNGQPALEVRFEAPFEGVDGLRFSGRIDKIASLQGDLYVVDLKTTKSALSDYYFNMYNPNTQIYSYLWVTRHILGLPVKGFMVDAIQTGVNFTRFGRQVFNVSDEQISEWHKDIQEVVRQVDYYHANDHWPGNFSACTSFGGCKFREACARNPSNRQAWLEADFVQRPYGGSASGS